MSTGYSSGFRTIFGFSFFFAKNFPMIVATFQFVSTSHRCFSLRVLTKCAVANGEGWDGYVRGI